MRFLLGFSRRLLIKARRLSYRLSNSVVWKPQKFRLIRKKTRHSTIKLFLFIDKNELYWNDLANFVRSDFDFLSLWKNIKKNVTQKNSLFRYKWLNAKNAALLSLILKILNFTNVKNKIYQLISNNIRGGFRPLLYTTNIF